MALWRMLIVISVALVMVACGRDNADVAPVNDLPPLPDPATMPMQVQNAAEEVAFAYRFAAAAPQVLKQMPCYCGCAPMGHDSNYACFWTETGELDPHGLNCGICIYIARDVWQGLEQGQTLAEIRTQIDADYGRYGPATDTPPVAERQKSDTQQDAQQ